VERVETSWRSPEGPVFQVQTKPGDRFVVRYHESEDRWIVKELPNSKPVSLEVVGSADEYQAGEQS
jgi:hypothetical protein